MRVIEVLLYLAVPNSGCYSSVWEKHRNETMCNQGYRSNVPGEKDGWINVLRFNVHFNSISVILGRCVGD